jgi:hypothetical protein
MQRAAASGRDFNPLPQERRMTDKRMLVCLVTALAALGAGLSAHHSAAVYENSTIVLKNVTMTGVIWANPHTILTFVVRDAKDSAATWSAESGSPTSLSRIGWNRNSVKAGDAVTIELNPARNGARVGRLSKVIFPDGRELLDSQVRGAPTQQ